jgi:protein SCO1/2
MNTSKTITTLSLSLTLSLLLHIAAIPASFAASTLPQDSVYQLATQWRDQDNTQLTLAELGGTVQIVAFMYTYCEHSCPVILSTLKKIDNQLTDQQKQEVNFLLISLDPERDTPAALKAYMSKGNLPQSRWRMLNGDADDVLELAAVFGVRYKAMDMNNDIAHSNMITVLGKQGTIEYQMKGLSNDLSTTIDAIGSLTQ